MTKIPLYAFTPSSPSISFLSVFTYNSWLFWITVQRAVISRKSTECPPSPAFLLCLIQECFRWTMVHGFGEGEQMPAQCRSYAASPGAAFHLAPSITEQGEGAAATPPSPDSVLPTLNPWILEAPLAPLFTVDSLWGSGDGCCWVYRAESLDSFSIAGFGGGRKA